MSNDDNDKRVDHQEEQQTSPPAPPAPQLPHHLPSGHTRAYAVRLHPGQDLGPALESIARKAMEECQSNSAFVMTAVGSLDQVTLRMANATSSSNNNLKQQQQGNNNDNTIRQWNERLEIVSLVGTFSMDGKHLHMSVSNETGEMFGGHFVSGRIYTTLELVLGTIDSVMFQRQLDKETGFRELVVTTNELNKN